MATTLTSSWRCEGIPDVWVSCCVHAVLLTEYGQPTGTKGEGTERGAGEGCSDAWPGSRLLLWRNPLGWTGPGPTQPNTRFSQKQSTDRISCTGSAGSFSFSTQIDKRNSRATRKLFHGRISTMRREPEVGRESPMCKCPLITASASC